MHPEPSVLIGPKKAAKLGLTSNRFSQQHMSDNAEQAINYVKKKDRSEIDVLLY